MGPRLRGDDEDSDNSRDLDRHPLRQIRIDRHHLRHRHARNRAGGGLGDRLRGGRSPDVMASWILADKAVFKRDLYTDGSVSFSRHS